MRAWGEMKLSDEDVPSDNGQALEPRDTSADPGFEAFRQKPAFGLDELRDLRAILGSLWARGAGTLEEALEVWQDVGPTGETAEATRRLLAVDLKTLLGIDMTPEEAWAAVLAFPERQSRVLRDRILAADTKSTLDQLGQDLGVTRERVRQIERLVGQMLRARLETEAGTVLRHLAARLARRLGNVTDPAAESRLVEEAVTATSGWAEDSEPRTELLRRLCGPVRADWRAALVS